MTAAPEGGYTPPQPGDREEGMEWTGHAWTAICPVDDIAMTERTDLGELCCPVCGVSFRMRRAEFKEAHR